MLNIGHRSGFIPKTCAFLVAKEAADSVYNILQFTHRSRQAGATTITISLETKNGKGSEAGDE